MIMIENQSISKIKRSDFRPDRDRLSELPLGIIHVILARVPIRDAVRTSILSRQWGYTWVTLPQLVFEDECASSDSKVIRKFEKGVEYFINRVLFNHKGPIHLFKLSVPFIKRSPDIDEWIRCLSRNDIKEVVLHMGEPDDHDSVLVHSSIYTCEKLTKLDLLNCELDPPPSAFKGFQFLRCLFLRDVCISSDEIESLVANTPLLERLVLVDLIEESFELRISSPKLKYMYINGDFIEVCVFAPLLAEMEIELSDNDFTAKHQQLDSSVCNYTNSMGGLTNIEKLSVNEYFTKYLSIGIESCHHTVVFSQLKDIELYNLNFEDIKVVSVVARLIVGAPNLQNLEIDGGYNNEGNVVLEAPRLSSSDFGCALNCTFEKLRIVRMRTSHVGLLGMEFLKFLLQSSPVLETMRVSMSLFRRFTEEEKQNVRAELLEFARASPNAKLSFYFRELVRSSTLD